MSRSVWQEPPSIECFLAKNKHKIRSELERKLIILVGLLQSEESNRRQDKGKAV